MPKFATLGLGREPIASYQHLLELGHGGMGTVNIARAVGAGGFERLVVVKRLNKELLDQQDAVRRFLDEARHAALIHHANVVGIHQIGRDEEGYFLVLDYVEGASLDGLVDRAALAGERIPPPIVLRIGLDALAGLQAAHRATDARGRELGLLHRDVSLQNVLVGKDGVARIADFGIAKSTLASVQTDHRYMVGKLLYSPPEYLWRKPTGPTLDVYALGMTLWIAFAGIDPWPDVDDAQLMTLILHEGVPRLSEAGIRIAPQVDALVAKACSSDPDDRYQSAREMGDAIEAIARETGWLATHGEVAEFLEKKMGVELKQRRERIAGLIERVRETGPMYESVRPPTGPIVSTRKIEREAATEPEDLAPAAASVDAVTSRIRRPPAAAGGSRRPLVAVGVAAAVIAGISAWVFARSGKPESARYEPVLAAPSATAAPRAPEPKSEPPPSANAGTTASVKEPEGAPSAATAKARVLPRGVDPPTLPKATTVTPRITPPPPIVAPVTTLPPPPKAPEGISKTNPYR